MPAGFVHDDKMRCAGKYRKGVSIQCRKARAQWWSTLPFHPVYQVVWLHFPCQWFNRDFVDFVVFGGGKVCRGCHGDCFVLTQQGGDGIAGLRLVIKV